MANTNVQFSIQFDGTDSINKLTGAIKETKVAMKDLDRSTAEYAEKAQLLGKLEGEIKSIKKQQDDVNKSFLESSSAIRPYDQLSAKLNRLRKDYKDLVVSGQEYTEQSKELLKEITDLDVQLKEVDATVGQFQRSVGNYPKTDLSGLISQLDKLQTEYNQLTDAQKESSEEAKKLKSQIDALDTEVKSITSSYDKLNAENNELKKQYKDLALQNKLNTAEAKALKVQIDALDASLKKADDTFKDSKNNSIGFGNALSGVGDSFGGVSTFASQAVNGVRAFGVAFKAALGPIGLIIAAIGLVIGSVRAFFNSSEEGQNKFRRLQAIAKVVFDNLTDIFERLGEIIVGVFEQPVESIKALGKFIYENITNRFIGLLELIPKLGKAMGEVFSGDFAAAGKTATDALAKITLGVADFTDKAISGFNVANNLLIEFAKNTEKEIAQRQKISDLQDALDKRERDVLIQNAKLQQQVAEARLKAAQTDKFSSEERLKFLDQAIAAELQTLKNAEDIAATKLSIAKQIMAQDDQDKDSLKEIAQLEADLINLRTQNYAETRRITGQRAQLVKELEAEVALTKSFTEEAAKFTSTIVEKTNKVITELIQNEFEKRRQLSQDNFNRDLSEIDATLEAQKKANEKNLKEIQEKYGKESQQAKDFLKVITEDEKKATEESAKFKEQREKQLQKEIIKIAEDEVKLKADIQKKAFDANLKREQETANMLIQQKQIQFNIETALLDKNKEEDAKKILKLEEQLNQDIYYITANRLKDEQELIENELKNNANLTIEEQTDLNNKLIALKNDEAKQFADNEQKKRDEVKKTSQEQEDAQRKAIENALAYAQEAVSIISGFVEAADQQRLERLEKDAEANAKIQEDLNNRLQNATGLERRYLEQQIENNVKTAERIEKEKEKIEAEAAKKRKATAIIESIINTALAVTRAYFESGPIGAVIAGIFGAAQTAVIAAQPLAKGGVVGKGDEIVQFASGGRVTSKGNIKPLSNGDNVLATLKTGEIVLNESQQRRIGYASLKKAQIPNFAKGGLVGAPSTLITNANNTIANEQMRVNLMDEMISATNNRIDRLSVVYTATTDFEVEKGRNDKKTIKANSTF